MTLGCRGQEIMALPSNYQSWRVPFPNLNLDPNDPVSPATSDYNCIAYAAGYNDRWFDNLRYWPPNLKRDWSIAGLTTAFATLGYEVCDGGAHESGFEKVAFYLQRATGKPTHAARQLPDGRWTSKCGQAEDVIHAAPEDLVGDVYGLPVAYMKRAVHP